MPVRYGLRPAGHARGRGAPLTGRHAPGLSTRRRVDRSLCRHPAASGRCPAVSAVVRPCRYGTVTPCSTTGPRVLSSSVAWETPGGVMVSITLATVLGSAEQIGAVPPTGQTPKE